MKKLVLLTISLLLATIGVLAQTDVTSQYLTNADFSTGWTTSNIGNNTVANVEGWTGTSTGDTWFYGGAISYAGGVTLNSVTVSSNPDGGTTGGALGLSAGWGCTVRYTQAVTLTPGRYRISYKAYNGNNDAHQLYNYIGFVEEGGTTHYGKINNFIPGTWMEESISVELTATTSGNISVGIGAVSGGSGANAKLFVDYIKIEAFNASETMMPGSDVTPGAWTGNSGTYQSTYPEYYSGSHFTGDVMTSTTSVDNGTYSADVYFHSHMAWISQAATDGSLNSYITANNVTRQVGIVNNTGFAGYEPTCYHLDDISVTNGSLVIKVGNSAQGGNWLTVKTDKITQMTTPYVSYGAFALPTTAVTADYWYQIPVTLAGTYTLTLGGSATVYYTQNATALTSGTFSTTMGGDLTLSAGTLYVKSSASVTLSLSATSYGYAVGDATVDKTYVQPGQTVTVTFPDAATSDPSASLTQSYSGVTLGGSSLTVTTGEKGFTFTVPSLVAGGNYTLAIPANAIGYAAGSTYNEAQTITLKTPAVYDGTYFLKNEAGQYLSRGADWGTRAIVDDWGLPIVVETDDSNNSTLKYADTGVYLYNSNWDAWADSGSPTNENAKWIFTLNDGKYHLASIQQSGMYVKIDSGSPLIWTDGAAAAATNWTMEATADHPALMTALRTAATSLSGNVSGLSSKTYLTNTPTAVTEQYERAIGENPAPDAFSGSIKVYPGIYKFTIAAFHRMGTNAATQTLHTAGADCPPMYAFFGDAKVQLKSVYDEYPTGDVGTTNSYNGHNYPNGVGGALTAFQEGKYQNTIWVEVSSEATINYGIHYQGKSTAAGRWTIWASDGIEITRYYDKATQGLDEADQLIEELRYTAGDFNETGAPDAADVQTLVDIMLGRNTSYNDAPIADIDGLGDGVTLGDLTKLVNVTLGREEARIVDETYTYANIDATVYAEQSASENATGAGYTIDSAVCSLTNEAVANPSSKYDMKDYLTTLNITTTLSNVVSVSVYAKGKENIAGLMTCSVAPNTAASFSYSAGTTPSVYVNGDRDDVNGKNMQSDVVTVTGSNAGTYTAYLLPVALSNGVTVTVRDSNGKYYSQDFTPSVGAVNNLTFTETTATNNWMATIPGNINFSMLSTPGAHNAATSSVSSSYSSQAQCQSETIQQLLDNGVRGFDIRPQYKSNSTIAADNLTIYHGSVSTGVLYKDAIATITSFLDSHPSEAISIIMTKEEGSGTDQTSALIEVVTSIHNNYSSYFKVLDHSYYTLDDFRGKIFYGCRPNWYVNTMTRVENWPDDSSVTNYGVNVGGTCTASVEDAYNTSGDSKKTVVNNMLNLASANTDRSKFHFTYTSVAWKLLGSSISSHANTQNPAAATYISGTLTGPAGYVYADYIGSSSYSGATLLKAIVDQNYKYVFKGRTRVQ